ncbi:hypothetical protein [Actinomadura fibrosa]|uniref:Uncharacterized protein n=2 Tax=Actinomadura fibrosa TaxID=111802 RepID=A0ABW2XT46_9ACTN
MPSPAPTAPTPTPDPFVDGRTLYCLKEENAGPLVDAAEKLHLAEKGTHGDRVRILGDKSRTELTVEKWARSGDWRRFQQACAAFAAEQALPDDPSDASWWTRVSGVVTGAVLAFLGAIFGLGATLVSTGKTERRRAADELRKAADGHYQACRACLEALRDGKGDALALQAAMEAPFNSLTAQLRRCDEAHRRWRYPGDLRKVLGDLDEAIKTANWTADPKTKAAGRFAELETARSHAQAVTHALVHPWRAGHRMRKGLGA